MSVAAGAQFTKEYPNLRATLASQATATAAWLKREIGTDDSTLFSAAPTKYRAEHYNPGCGVLLMPTEAELAQQPRSAVELAGPMLFNLIAAAARWPSKAFDGHHAFVDETSFGTEKGLLKIFEGFMIGPAAAATTCKGCWPGPDTLVASAT